jgi:hypothetical protein
MAEGYQRKHRCGDEGKSMLRHSPPLSIKNCNRRDSLNSRGAVREKTSSSGQEALDRLCPLPARGVIAGDFSRADTRHIPLEARGGKMKCCPGLASRIWS